MSETRCTCADVYAPEVAADTANEIAQRNLTEEQRRAWEHHLAFCRAALMAQTHTSDYRRLLDEAVLAVNDRLIALEAANGR